MLVGNKEIPLKDIFDLFYTTLCFFACRFTHDQEASADIVQEAFITLFESKDSFEKSEDVKAFLYTVVRNKCLNHLKHLKVVDKYNQSYVETPQFFKDALIEEETNRIIQAAIDDLPPRSRKVIEYSLKGMNNPKIADALKVSLNTIKTLKRQSYIVLRKRLKKLLIFTFLIFYLF